MKLEISCASRDTRVNEAEQEARNLTDIRQESHEPFDWHDADSTSQADPAPIYWPEFDGRNWTA